MLYINVMSIDYNKTYSVQTSLILLHEAALTLRRGLCFLAIQVDCESVVYVLSKIVSYLAH